PPYSSHSVVVMGKLRTHVFEPGKVGIPVSHYREDGSLGECSSFVNVGETHLSSRMSADVISGASYSMSADVIHQVEPPQELAVTMFLELEQVKNTSDIFVRAGDVVP